MDASFGMLRRAVFPSMSSVPIGCSGLSDSFSHQSKAPGDWDGSCVSVCLKTSNTSHNFCRPCRAQISTNGWKIQPHYYIYIFFFTHDALVCHVASTTEKTWLQTTRDQHMHPTVQSLCVSMWMYLNSRESVWTVFSGWSEEKCIKMRKGICFSCSYVWRVLSVCVCTVCESLCWLFKVLGMHRSTGSEQRMQLEAWPSVQHKNNGTNLQLCMFVCVVRDKLHMHIDENAKNRVPTHIYQQIFTPFLQLFHNILPHFHDFI